MVGETEAKQLKGASSNFCLCAAFSARQSPNGIIILDSLSSFCTKSYLSWCRNSLGNPHDGVPVAHPSLHSHPPGRPALPRIVISVSMTPTIITSRFHLIQSFTVPPSLIAPPSTTYLEPAITTDVLAEPTSVPSHSTAYDSWENWSKGTRAGVMIGFLVFGLATVAFLRFLLK
jgi:hypothetical protein